MLYFFITCADTPKCEEGRNRFLSEKGILWRWRETQK
jgi:hypothetical protein